MNLDVILLFKQMILDKISIVDKVSICRQNLTHIFR